MKRRPRTPARRRVAEKKAHESGPFLPVLIGMSGGIALATVAFWFFQQQADQVVAGKADKYDTALMDLIHSYDSPHMNEVMHGATAVGSHVVVGTVAGMTAIHMFRRHRKHDAWTIIISTGGAMVLNAALKAIFQRQRPQELARRIRLPRSHSFPSGHSLLSAATYPIVAHHLVETQSPQQQMVVHAFVASAILGVGFSRVYLGVHFPSDVLGGFAAGLGWLGLTSLSHTVFGHKVPEEG